MSENKLVLRLIAAAFVAIAFTLIGTSAPVLYATHAPQDSFIKVNSFTAQDASVGADRHYICFDRNVRQSTSGVVYTELYLITDEEDRREVAGKTMDRYFQKGNHAVLTPNELPDGLRPGTYRYLLIIEMDLADGRVERDFAFESQPFNITEVGDSYPTRAEFGCS